PLWGSIMIFLALTYNVVSQYISLKQVPEKSIEPQKAISKCVEFEDFYGLCQALIPLIDDNKYIFGTFGPNSSASTLEPLRTDLSLWHESRKEYIIPNNSIIECLINKNEKFIPANNIEIFRRLKSHIYAYKKHVENTSFDYSDYQFPREIEQLIKHTCYDETTNNKDFKRIANWVDKKLSLKQVCEKSIIGSLLFSTKYSKDLDVLLLLNVFSDEDLVDTKKKLRSVQYSFKLKFKKNIHLTVFSVKEKIEYQEFLRKNDFKFLLNGERLTLFDFAFYKKCFKWA
ncbi:MAG: hypothetical protein JSU01_07615, partial [Bacteroidetes bacterium]|nr:hypothetical protein [Bacteroidota bacterium]